MARRSRDNEQPDPTAPRCDKCSVEMLFAHGDDEGEALVAAYPDARIVCLYIAGKITCRGCGRVLHNCTSRWIPDSKWSRGGHYELSCAAPTAESEPAPAHEKEG